MSCILTKSERAYSVQIPYGYWTLAFMPEFSYEEWLRISQVAGEQGQMRPELASLIINSLGAPARSAAWAGLHLQASPVGRALKP